MSDDSASGDNASGDGTDVDLALLGNDPDDTSHGEDVDLCALGSQSETAAAKDEESTEREDEDPSHSDDGYGDMSAQCSSGFHFLKLKKIVHALCI